MIDDPDANNSIDWTVEFERVSKRLEQSRRELEEQKEKLIMDRKKSPYSEQVTYRRNGVLYTYGSSHQQARDQALESLRELREKMDKPSRAERAWSRVKEGSQFRNPVKAYWRMIQIALGRKVDGE